MDDLISRQAAIDAVEKESQVDGAYGYMDTKSIVDLLMDLPSAQPEVLAHGEGELSAEPEIIHCKDCKWFRRWIDTDIEFCDLTETTVFSTDFCSRAER